MESQALIENEWTSYYPVNAHNSGSVNFFFQFSPQDVVVIIHFDVEAYYVTLVPTGLNLLLYIIDTIIIHRKDIECILRFIYNNFDNFMSPLLLLL